MKEQQLLCRQANQYDMVDYLEKLGYQPQKIRNTDFWYLSPLRTEKTPSFKVNRRLNVWYDHGIGKGGTLVDFGKLYYRCSVKELLLKLEGQIKMNVSFHPQNNSQGSDYTNAAKNDGKIKILSASEISDPILRQYLHQRKIPLAIANQFCHEVCFELYGKKHLAIGFQNNSGGYELRNQYFKGSSSPKATRLIRTNGGKELSVFEGFFSFLSFQTLLQTGQKASFDSQYKNADFLILNSLSFFEKSRQTMEQYPLIRLFLDRDAMGSKCTQKALTWGESYWDESKLYSQVKDLNEYLIKSMTTDIALHRKRGMQL